MRFYENLWKWKSQVDIKWILTKRYLLRLTVVSQKNRAGKETLWNSFLKWGKLKKYGVKGLDSKVEALNFLDLVDESTNLYSIEGWKKHLFV